MHGYGLVKKLCDELEEFMKKHNFSSIEDFRGYILFQIFVQFKSILQDLCFIFICFRIFLSWKNLVISVVFFCVSVSLQYFTTHTELVRRQQEAINQRKAVRRGLQSDKDWTGDGFVKETESMISNWRLVPSSPSLQRTQP